MTTAPSHVRDDDPDRHLNLAQAAALMGISTRAARRLRDTGRLPYTRIGHAVRFRRGDVLDLLAANRSR